MCTLLCCKKFCFASRFCTGGRGAGGSRSKLWLEGAMEQMLVRGLIINGLVAGDSAICGPSSAIAACGFAICKFGSLLKGGGLGLRFSNRSGLMPIAICICRHKPHISFQAWESLAISVRVGRCDPNRVNSHCSFLRQNSTGKARSRQGRQRLDRGKAPSRRHRAVKNVILRCPGLRCMGLEILKK